MKNYLTSSMAVIGLLSGSLLLYGQSAGGGGGGGGGYDRPRPMGSGAGGGRLCAPVFDDFMTEAVEKYARYELRVNGTLQPGG